MYREIIDELYLVVCNKSRREERHPNISTSRSYLESWTARCRGLLWCRASSGCTCRVTSQDQTHPSNFRYNPLSLTPSFGPSFLLHLSFMPVSNNKPSPLLFSLFLSPPPSHRLLRTQQHPLTSEPASSRAFKASSAPLMQRYPHSPHRFPKQPSFSTEDTRKYHHAAIFSTNKHQHEHQDQHCYPTNATYLQPPYRASRHHLLLPLHTRTHAVQTPPSSNPRHLIIPDIRPEMRLVRLQGLAATPPASTLSTQPSPHR